MLRACIALLLGLLAGDASAAQAAPGEVAPKLATLAEPDQQYSLYLPDGYDAGRRWPVLIILDARGRGESILRLALEGARARGWIVISSYQSRSDTDENITLRALQALLRETGQRYAYDPKRIYLAGFSGTAKTLWTQVEPLRGVVAGIIGCGGGRPPELGPLRRGPAAFFGIAGTRDFNYQEMRDLDAQLGEIDATRRLEVFDGPHSWPDAAVFAEAIAWFDLMAMREGRMPRDEAWIDTQYAQRLAQAQAEADGDLQDLRRWEQLARDFEGLRDTGRASAAVAALAARSSVRAALADENRLRAEERRSSVRLNEWIARLSARDANGRRNAPPGTPAAVRELRIASLQSMSRGADRAQADSAQRRLAYIGAAVGFYLPRRYESGGDPAMAEALLRIALAIDPGRGAVHWHLARVLARMNRKDAAFDEMEAARGLGYWEDDDLRTNDAWGGLRDDPRWRGLSPPADARE